MNDKKSASREHQVRRQTLVRGGTIHVPENQNITHIDERQYELGIPDRTVQAALAAYIAGEPRQAVLERLAPPWRGRFAAASANGHSPRQAVVETLDGVIPGGEVDLWLLRVAPRSQPTRAEIDTSHQWLDAYVSWASAVSPMTPAFFHEASGLWLASVAVARRLVLPLAHDQIYPNLWIAWIAPTTLYAKSTGMKLARRIAQLEFPHLLSAQTMTPEALLADLAGQEPSGLSEEDRSLWQRGRDFAGQRGLILDEFSGLLARAGRDYSAGLVEDLLRFHDCEGSHRSSTKGGGWITVHNSYLSLFGSSTPGILRPYLADERLWSSGWWPRFALLYPDGRPQWLESQQVERPALLSRTLSTLLSRLPSAQYPTPATALTVTLGRGVHDAWRKYDRAMRYDKLTDDLPRILWAYYGRLPTQALKVAILLAALEWQQDAPAPQIELRHFERAQQITETWRRSAHKLVDHIYTSRAEETEERVRRIITEAGPEGISARDVKRKMRGVQTKDVDLALGELARREEILAFNHQPPGGGRPSQRFRAS